METVAIVEDKTPKLTLLKGFQLLKDIENKIRVNGKILVLIDALIPEGCPCTVNPDTLGALLEYLDQFNPTHLYVCPISLKSIDQEKLLSLLGLSDFIKSKSAIPITQEQLYQKIIQNSINLEDGESLNEISNSSIIDQSNASFDPKNEPLGIDASTTSKNVLSSIESSQISVLLDQIDNIFILNQLRTDPILGLHTSLPLLQYFVEKQDKNIELEESSLVETKDSKIFNQSLWKQPLVVINDAFYFLEGNGPFIQDNSMVKITNRMFISTNLAALDWVTLNSFGYKNPENYFLKIAKSQGHLPSNPDTDIQILKSENIADIDSYIKAEEDLNQLSLRKIKLYPGEMDEKLKYAFLQFLYNLRSYLYKDIANIGEIAILVGANPPEPVQSLDNSQSSKNSKSNVPSTIILFGDQAIQTTKTAKFRRITKMKEVLEGYDLDKAIMKYQAKIRLKIDKERLKFDELVADLDHKIDALDREETKLQKQKKLELKISKLELKIKQYRIKMTAKHKTRAIENKIPKVVLNQEIISISGQNPLGWDTLIPLIHFWKGYQIPLLSNFIHTASRFYNFRKWDDKLMKNEWKQSQKELEKQLKLRDAPLKAEIENALKEVKSEKKSKLNQLKNEGSHQKNQIKEKFDQKLKELKDNFENQDNFSSESSEIQNQPSTLTSKHDERNLEETPDNE